MMKRMICAALALMIIITGLAAVPAMAAENYYTSRTSLSGTSAAKRNNIELAADAINGAYVSYGESFSFNDIVGPRTKGYGYVSAPNGRGAKVTGGGVAQVASTLYLALLEVPGKVAFDELKTYGSRFADDYVDDGDYAVITDYSADTDFAFTNYTDDMYIEMWMNDNYLYCCITLGESGNDDDFEEIQWGGDWSSGFTETISAVNLYCGRENGVLNNVEIAAGSINDTTLSNGDIFSFNDIVGPRSEKYGYEIGTNGRGAKVVGGGVAQVASAVWMAVKDVDDIAIMEKSTYGSKYNQDYVFSSADAIVTDYSAGTDFSFRYTGDGSITICTWLTDDTLWCEIQKN